MNSIVIQQGEKVMHKSRTYIITRIVDLSWVLGEEENTGKIERLRINDLEKFQANADNQSSKKDIPIETIDDRIYAKAEKRFSIIKPILDNPGNGYFLKQVSERTGKSTATLYRWVELFKQTGKVSSLVPLPKGGKGITRISVELEEIIKTVIEDVYLNKQKKSIQKTCIEVLSRCKQAGFEPPHINTVRNRIAKISEYEKVKSRLGKREADLRFGPKIGKYPDALSPLSVVMIDHTKLDIILVDEEYRKPIGRPWITIAIDVFSRMVTGFYVSMDPPGILGAGLCVSSSILPKDSLLSKYDIKGEWPCWGIMKTIYLDNAKEFRSESLIKSCSEYNIDISWRPVAKPEWGGHIERLIGTYVKEIHNLPGTTFSNIKDRQGYDSTAKASLTLSELDKWLVTFTVEVYHKRVHSALGTSPLQKYKEGVFGENGKGGIGIPPRINDPVRLKLDFLPSLERTVQDYGVLIDHIYYYNDVLRRWINSTDPGSGKARIRRKFIFKRDPRDISIVYFLDPDLKEYFPIPYRDITHPAMSLWEFNEIINNLNKEKKRNIQEEDIFEGYEKLKIIEREAVSRTKVTKKANMKAFKREEARNKRASKLSNETNQSLPYEEIDITPNVKPESFDNIDF